MDGLRLGAGKLAAIYAGGVLGALARVGLAEAFPAAAGTWPWPTFAVNLLGALLIGYLFARLRDRDARDLAHPFLATGLCGTLTTFSTLQLELFGMVDAGRTALALTYLAASLAAGLACVRIGIGAEARWSRGAVA